jgi:Ca2+-binding RTX toxin-like protein
MEALEPRRLMAATVEGLRVLIITADDTPTTVDINVVSRTTFTLTIDGGAPVDYSLRRVRGVRFFGGAGDDVFRINSLATDPANGIRRAVLFNRKAVIWGGDGNDTIYDGYGNSRINGGLGNDTIYGGGGSDNIVGSAGDDIIFGGPRDTEPSLRDGNDVIFGGSGNDTIDGGRGNDVMFGQDGDDILIGSTSRDALYGNAGNDTLIGGPDRDILYAGGQDGDILQDVQDRDRANRGELKGMTLYLSRIVRAYVPAAMQADARL